MGRKTKDIKPTCKSTGLHNYDYIADDYSYTPDGYWEIYKCSRCDKSITVKVAD